ncbi:hypothetical protein N7532_010360 [Penicillium argentinense]|uniref:Cytochrome P450 n=1 Tax=Penicillium argentinense TaxID=1131581 RepID=A0A9W9JXK2_9EURO|nr:uncharacterized protein N7532_010360 [Penicillium argentinense]KAJ5085589.1 hypothetical protein N7532_010360 [Penicillium argentinense]
MGSNEKYEYVFEETIENRRLAGQHQALKIGMGKLVLAPLHVSHKGLRILDTGTSDGYWLADFRHSLAHPESYELTAGGAELSGTMAQILAANLLDLVHQRLTLFGLGTKSKECVLELMKIVKPGGWIQLMAAFSLLNAIKAKQNSLSTLIIVNTSLILFAYFLISRSLLFIRRRRFSRENGCKPLLARYKDRLFEISFIIENAKAFKQKAYLSKFTSRYFTIAHTHEVLDLGGRGVFTIHPLKIKTMLSLKFKTTPCVVDPSVENAETIDLLPLFFRFTMNSSTEFLFGTSSHTLTEGGDQIFSDSFVYGLYDIALGMRLGPWQRFRRTDPKAVEAHRFCREDVDKHRKLRDELLSLLLAGRDTTASLISSLFFSLAKRPDIWRKLREEIITELNGQKPTYDQVRNLKYAKYCVNETLRLYPSVPNNAKMATKDTILPVGGGPDGNAPILIEKGTMVIYTVYVMHHRKDLFGEDAEEFRPERWVKNDFIWQYLPFSGSPRVCLGQQYASTETLYVLVRFTQEFEEINIGMERIGPKI